MNNQTDISANLIEAKKVMPPFFPPSLFKQDNKPNNNYSQFRNNHNIKKDMTFALFRGRGQS